MARSFSRSRLLLFACCLGLNGCEKEPTELEKLGVSEDEARDILKKIEAEKSVKQPNLAPPSVEQREPRADVDTEERAPPPKTEQDVDPSLESERFVVDGLVDVAPAGQSSAHARGVFMVTRGRRLLLAPLGPLPKGPAPGASPIAELPEDNGPFEIARGPSFSASHAYWVSEHYVFRHALPPPGKDPDPTAALAIASDARVATRVSALTHESTGKDFVAYIALPTEKGSPLRAKLWTDAPSEVVLTEEGSAALSVQLTQDENGFTAYSLEGRTGMSVLHARTIDIARGVPVLGPDRVVWVGGGATPTTELRLARDSSEDVFGLLPIEQDISHFGMAILELTSATEDDPAPNQWALYPNGMEYSPTDGSVICGKLSVLFARPSGSAPHDPQELVLAELDGGRLSTELILSRSKAYFDASIAALPAGALVSYVADRRTWARTLRCANRQP